MNRTLGSHELNAYHINKSQGNLNITVGLLLRTETAIDKGKIYYLVLYITHFDNKAICNTELLQTW